MAVIADIADALVAEINAGDFPFTARREYAPRMRQEEIAELQVIVVPRTVTATTNTRAGNDPHEFEFDVGFLKRVAADDSDEIDELLGLVENVADYLRKRKLMDAPAAKWRRMQVDPVYAVEALDEGSRFTSRLTISYVVFR